MVDSTIIIGFIGSQTITYLYPEALYLEALRQTKIKKSDIQTTKIKT